MNPLQETQDLASAVRSAERKLLRGSVSGKSRDQSVQVKIANNKISTLELDKKSLKINDQQEQLIKENIIQAVNAALRKKQRKTNSVVDQLVQ
jgi:DNA-binding protein YbaB